jgi:hypothetical protein
MADEYSYDLSGFKDRLLDQHHASGCPARPDRIEPEVVRGPDVEAFVQQGVVGGQPAMVKRWVPGPPSVKVRCNMCGGQVVDPVDEEELLKVRIALGASAGGTEGQDD